MRFWRTHPDGTIEIDDGDGWQMPTLAGPNDSTARVLALVPTALAPAAALHAVPITWLCAIAYTESGGRPDAIGPTNDYGLMQIIKSNWKNLGLTEENWMDPAVNAAGAAKLIRLILNRKPERINNFPEVCSVYNSGGDAQTGEPYPSEKSPWGMRETAGSTDGKVAASNWFTMQLAGNSPAPPLGGGSTGGPTSSSSSGKSKGGGGALMLVGAAAAFFFTRGR